MAFGTSEQIDILVTLHNQAAAELSKLRKQLGDVESGAHSMSGSWDRAKSVFAGSMRVIGSVIKTASVAIGGATAAAVYMGSKFQEASIRMENAMLGLSTIARAFKQDTEKATAAARMLASDGLMTVGEAAGGLKNLLSSGFGLEEAITLMKGFKDSAAFNRQAALGFGQAIVGATEGIKNQNSILVDNAGITKNLSIILQEAGYSIQDLQNVQSDANVRQALYNGLLKETAIFQGDAGKASESLSGQIQKNATSWEELKALIGDGLKPVFERLQETLANTLGQFTYVNEDGVKKLTPEMERMIAVINDKLIKAFDWAIAKAKELYQWYLDHQEELRNLWAIMEAFGYIVVKTFNFIIAALKVLRDQFDTAFSRIIDRINAVQDAWNAMKKIVEKGIEAVVKIKEKFSSDDKNEKAHGGYIRGRAMGGSISSMDEVTLVGENGPEILKLPVGSKVIPNHQSRIGSNVTHVWNFQGAIIQGKEELIRTIESHINRKSELAELGSTV